MIRLSINLNKIALIRNSREGNNPDLLEHAQRCVQAGVHGLTVHPRPDQRHIRAQDIAPLSALCRQNDLVEFNVEGNPFADARPSLRNDVSDYPGFVELIQSTQADQCTLVPDTDQQLTSDHGFDLRNDTSNLQAKIKSCQANGARVSLFMDPEPEQIRLAADLGVDCIELYTGPFSKRYAEEPADHALFERYVEAALCAQQCGLAVNAGHDLNLNNLKLFRELPGLQEVSIGHAFTVDSLEMGIDRALSAYLSVLSAK